MPDDDETTVRQRLVRLLGDTVPAGRAAPAPPPLLGRPAALDPLDLPRPGLPDPEPAEDELSERPRLAGPGAFDPGRRGVKALAAVAAVVVLGAAGWAWLSRPTAEPVPAASSGAAPSATRSGASGDVHPGSSRPADGASPAEVVVAVAGKVRRPGLVRLPPGARVADAIEAAGGALPGVDVAMINPARKVTDGELIVVGAPQPPAAAAPGAGQGSAGTPPGGKVNLNTATLAQVDALPGVGPVLAQRILDYREQHGGFRSVGDLRQVNGIGDARYQDLKDLVTV